ncbi:hypothetical protein [Falsiroseomonas oryzae]|uniref:hypothetical protein n=1 Tax=Falsiroseomonas oryzae TaxID=2766473 RepID=UPI0022EAE617|nr:hypothetical protein [Roseomonas sp. MO-31]
MLDRRSLLLVLPLAAAGCATGSAEDEPLPRLVTGYRHLTPIRLNVADVQLVPPAAGAVRVDEPAPVRPDAEMALMARERLVPMGTAGQARFIVQAAEFLRERLPRSPNQFGSLSGEPGERLTCRVNARLEVISGEGERVGFVEAEARRQRTTGSGASQATRLRAAEDVVRQAMDDLNVEFEFQIRRALRAWLVQSAAPTALGPGGIEREDLAGR